MNSYNHSFNYLLDGIIPVEDLDEYFGEFYLDMTIDQTESIFNDVDLIRISSILFFVFLLSGIFGFGLTIWNFFL